MNTKTIGNIGEAKVLCKFVELGIPVYVPFGDNEKADLIAEFNGKLNKIQVKTAINAQDGVINFNISSSHAHRTNGGRHKYTEDEVDYFACYSVARDSIYLVPITCSATTAFKIRYEMPKNGQIKGVNFEKDYLIDNVLCVETLHEISKEQ